MPIAGWYAAPGEPGVLRWWNGDGWATNRQPAPAAVAAPAAVSVAASSTGPGPAESTSVASDAESVWNSVYTSPPAPVVQGSANGKWSFQWAWQKAPDGLLVADENDIELGQSPLKRAMSGFIVGALIIVGSIIGIVYLASTLSVPAGDLTVTGHLSGVNSVYNPGIGSHPGGYSCYPVAQYVVGPSTYTATSRVGTDQCLWSSQQTVQVAYSPSSPSIGTVIEPIGVAWEVFLFPLAGIGLILLTLRVYLARRAVARTVPPAA